MDSREVTSRASCIYSTAKGQLTPRMYLENNAPTVKSCCKQLEEQLKIAKLVRVRNLWKKPMRYAGEADDVGSRSGHAR